MVDAVSVAVVASVTIVASVQMSTDAGTSVGATATVASPQAASTPLLPVGAAVAAAAGGGGGPPEAYVSSHVISLGLHCQYLQWQADCLVQHFHPFEVAKVLNPICPPFARWPLL
jgi:hypothetical protein